MTLTELKNKANPILADFWTALVAKQEAYHAKHGKYFQLLVTPNAPVVDGVDSDFEKRSPNDERFAVDVDFAFASKIPFNIQIDEWVGKNAQGFSATVTVTLPDARVFTRTRQYPSQEDTGWVQDIKE